MEAGPDEGVAGAVSANETTETNPSDTPSGILTSQELSAIEDEEVLNKLVGHSRCVLHIDMQ